jgi:hypothetical protein
MEGAYEIDLDRERVFFEGEWLGCQELADKIRRMIDSQDFRIGTAGNALEYLQTCLATAREFSVRLAPQDVVLLERHAQRSGIDTGVFIRQAVQAYLAAQPPLEDRFESRKQSSAITTEPARPEDAGSAVALTERKPQPPPGSTP